VRVVELALDRERYAVPEAGVVELAARVAVAPLPGAPEFVRGIVRVRGELAVAVDLRARLGLPTRPPLASDHLVVVRTPRRLVALEVDRVTGLGEREAPSPLPAPAPRLSGVLSLDGGVALIVDLDALLDLDDERRLDDAIAAVEPPRG
jgi:purine-binding chemotaxis protein CheW